MTTDKRAPRVFIDEESDAKRLRKVRACALEEANYAVCQEMATGRYAPVNAEEQDRAVLRRALVFERYLLDGHQAAMQQVRSTEPCDCGCTAAEPVSDPEPGDQS